MLTLSRLWLLLRFGLFQLVGTVAGAVASILVVRRFGLDGAGQIAYLRNAAELAVAFVVLGLPQAVAFQLAVGRVAMRSLLRPVAAFSGLACIILILTFLVWSPHSTLEFSADVGVFLWLAAIGILSAQVWRSFLLSNEVSSTYSIASISTNLVLLFAVCIWPSGDSSGLWRAVSSGWAVVGLLIVAIVVSQSRVHGERAGTSSVALLDLLRDGWWVWLQQISVVGQISLMFHFLQKNADALSVGVTATALVLYNVISGPAAMIAPALFRMWAGAGRGIVVRREFVGLLAIVTIVMVAVIALSVPFGKVFVELTFGREMAQQMPLLYFYLASAWLGTLCKLSVPLLQAYGFTRPLALAYFGRLVPISLLFIVSLFGSLSFTAVEQIAFAFLMGEAFCFGLLLWFSRMIRSPAVE